MPTKTDPATNLPLTDAEVATAWDATMGAVTGRDAYFNWPFLPEPDRFRARAFARAAYALAASRVDTAEVERRAARKALAECAAWLGKGESQPVRFDEDGRFLLAFERVNAFSDRYLAREYPAPAPRECRKHEGDFFGVPLYSDPNCPADRVVFEYDGKAVACALIHPDSTALRRNAAEVGQ